MHDPIEHLGARTNHVFDIDDCLFSRKTGLHHAIKHRIVDHFNALTQKAPHIHDDFTEIVKHLGRDKDFDMHNVQISDLEAAFLPIVTALKWNYQGADFFSQLDAFYDVDYSVIEPDIALVDAFDNARSKDMQVYIYTNGASHPHAGHSLHKQRVLKGLGFDQEWIEYLRPRTQDLLASEFMGNGKPYKSSFAQMLNRFGLDPRDTAFYDDTVPNIVTASQFDVMPVWPWLTDEPAPQDLEAMAQSINAIKTNNTARTFQSAIDLHTPKAAL